MSNVNGISNANPALALKPAAQTAPGGLRVTPSTLSEAQFSSKLSRAAQASPSPDTINFSQAAQRLSQRVASAPSPTYGTNGLQATTPAAARQALAATATQMVAARVSQPMDFVSGQAPARGTAVPFYTNPAIANGVATSTNAARVGTSIDATG